MYGNRRGTTFARRPLLLRLRRWPTGAVLSSLCRRRDQYLGEHRHRHYGQGLRRLMCAATGDQTVSSLHATDLSSQNNKTLQPAGQAGAPDLFRTINAVTRLGRRDAWPLPYNCATSFIHNWHTIGMNACDAHVPPRAKGSATLPAYCRWRHQPWEWIGYGTSSF